MREGTAPLHPPRVLPQRLRLQRLLARPRKALTPSRAARGGGAPSREAKKNEKPGKLRGTGVSLSVPLPPTIATHAKAHGAPGEEPVLESRHGTGLHPWRPALPARRQPGVPGKSLLAPTLASTHNSMALPAAKDRTTTKIALFESEC